MNIAQRLAGGYLRILGRLLRGLLALCVLALLAAAITLPLWALANAAQTVYNVFFLLVTASGVVMTMVLRRRNSRTRRDRRAPMIVVGTVLSLLVLLLGVVGRSSALVSLGLGGLSVPLAWSFGKQR